MRVSPPTRALLALAAIWLILFSPQLFAHRAFLFGDATLYRRFSEFSRQRWVTLHERTFWNPYVFFGLPSTASLADQRPQYLPDAMLDIWERLRSSPAMPPLFGPLLAHLAGVLSTALLVRALWAAGVEAMIWAGLGWALMPGLVVPLAFGHDAQFLSASLIPLLLLLIHAAFANRSALGAAWAALGIAGVVGIQCLHGHPQMVAAGFAFAIGFAVERAHHFGRPGRLLAAGAGLALGVSIGSASWWPALRYAAESVRGGVAGVDARAVGDFSQSWRDLLSLAWPRAVGFGGGSYWGGLRKTDFPQFAGSLICALSLVAWPRAARKESAAVGLLAVVAAAGILLSLGSHLPFLDRALRARVPFFAAFRVSVVWLILTDLSLVLLSALGLERLSDVLASRDRLRVALAVGSAAAGLVVLTGLAFAVSPLRDVIAGWSLESRPALNPALARSAAEGGGLDLAGRGLLLAITCSLGLLSRRWRPIPAVASVALALHALDLGSVSVPFMARTSGPAASLAAPPPPELARLAAADPLARALPLEPSFPLSDDWVSWRARCASGVHGTIERDWATMMAAGLPFHYEALCALAVRYATVAPGTPDRPELWARSDSSRGGPPVIRLRHARDRAYCVPRVAAPGDHERVLEALLSPAFRASDLALAEDPLLAGDYPGSAECRLTWFEDSPDRLRIACDAPAPAFLVVADTWFAGWSATLDGHPAPIARVDYLVRGLPIPAGSHRVEMQYSPDGWRDALPVTRGGLGVGAIAAAILLELGRRRRARQKEEPGRRGGGANPRSASRF